jgi:SAM-dependent methyltransferase
MLSYLRVKVALPCARNDVDMKKEWFEAWFDSPFYHILYKSRDEQEARQSLDNLLAAMDLHPGASILDLACGKGRHSRFLAEKGYRVTGIDISESSIAFARQFETVHLEFYQHDMRQPFRTNYFDGIINMFTSFGYFKTDAEHFQALRRIAQNLKPGGIFLLDYFNSLWIRTHLVAAETKTVDGVAFDLKKYIQGGHVYKTVTFEQDGALQTYSEAVRLFELADFQRLFNATGLTIHKTLGDYDLTAFDAARSPRLILVAEKTG